MIPTLKGCPASCSRRALLESSRKTAFATPLGVNPERATVSSFWIIAAASSADILVYIIALLKLNPCFHFVFMERISRYICITQNRIYYCTKYVKKAFFTATVQQVDDKPLKHTVFLQHYTTENTMYQQLHSRLMNDY